MGLFKSKTEKEIEKKMLVKKTVNAMNKQIKTLEDQKVAFVEKAKTAKKNGLRAQYNLALTRYKMTVLQQKRAQEMLLNFEITSQMKDMSMMTKEFLGGMSLLSKEMAKLSDEKEFLEVQKQFEKAMGKAERQAEQMDMFMEMSQESFRTAGGATDSVNDKEIKDLIEKQSGLDESADDEIDAELARLRSRIEGESDR